MSRGTTTGRYTRERVSCLPGCISTALRDALDESRVARCSVRGFDDGDDLRRRRARDIAQYHLAARQRVVDAGGGELLPPRTVTPHKLSVAQQAHARVVRTEANLRAARMRLVSDG